MTEEEILRRELLGLNREIAAMQDSLDRLKHRRDQLQALFPHPETPAPRIVQESFAIG